MDKHKNSQSGFAVIEGLLLVLVLAVIGFGGYYVYHSQKQSKSNQITPTTVAKTSDSPKTPPTQTQYLKISEFGIELPLTTAIADLTYTPPPVFNGQTQPIAYLSSATQLAKQIQAIDPACPGGSYSLPGGEYITTNDPTASNSPIIATATVGGKAYYLTTKGGSGSCDPNATTTQNSQIQSVYTAYTNEVMNAFKSAKAL